MSDTALALVGLFILVAITNVALYVFTWQQARLLKKVIERLDQLEHR